MSHVTYLGHVISRSSVQMKVDKVLAVKEWLAPRTVKQLCGFLGLATICLQFWHHSCPIDKEEWFQWTPQAKKAFAALMQAVMSVPVQAMPNFDIPFEVEANASDIGIRTILSQNQHPLAFFGCAMGSTFHSKSAYVRELTAIVLAVLHWRHYQLGRKFIVPTYHHSLRYLLDLGLDSQAHSTTASVQRIRATMQEDPTRKYGYIWNPPYLYFWDHIYLPTDTDLPGVLITHFHDSKDAGHEGVEGTYRRLWTAFFWPSMKRHIRDYIKGYDVCQRNKYKTHKPAGLLQPLPISEQIWEDISMDFIEGLPRSRGKSVNLVVVDRLSKYAHFVALGHPFTAKTVAHAFQEHVGKLLGMPQSIISDRDWMFLSVFWREYFHLQVTNLKMSTAYHPQTDGQTEIINRCVETYL
ncbi:uncharacterized protein LOC116260216 [Nymphaea colorata]|uniref:uncharacterized protein LOC116260216 n=1 Tax=Nymphaea colorata TaxID=210225 RepID=UPI00129DF0BB|nr:uncharacterized protein LOC116260216 [Nymphaea colorata]